MTTVAEAICQQGYCIIDQFLPTQVQHQLYDMAALRHAEGTFSAARIGRQQNLQHNHTIRRDQILWLEDVEQEPAIQTYFNTVNTLASSLNQALFLGLHYFESHFAVYNVGDFYRKHVDQFAKTSTRKISCVYYLNPQWQENFGGELKLYDSNHNLLETVIPWGNRFICFTSDLPHEVCETHHLRFSIAGWLKTR